METSLKTVVFAQKASGQPNVPVCRHVSQGGVVISAAEVVEPRGTDESLLHHQCIPGQVIRFDEFFMAQGEKGYRSNVDEDTNQRKVTRYSSQSALSGLLICSECGRSYRRITRSSGKVVWRCANRVEHGKRRCKHSPSIPKQQIKYTLCAKLEQPSFDEQTVKGHIGHITVLLNGTLEIEAQQLGLFLS